MSADPRSEAIDAVKTGDRATLAQLLAAHPELVTSHDENGVSLTLLALYHRQPELADILAQAHPALDIFESSALGLVDRVEELIATKPERIEAEATDGFTALHLAAYFGQDAVATTLIDKGADVDAISGNPAQLRPLHAAAASRSSVIAEALLEAGAEVGAQQGSGHTAMDAARQNQDDEMIAVLEAWGG